MSKKCFFLKEIENRLLLKIIIHIKLHQPLPQPMLPLDKPILQGRAGVPVIDAAENQIADRRVSPVLLLIVLPTHIPDDIDNIFNPLVLPFYIRVHLIE
jgi:hypothetical protein